MNARVWFEVWCGTVLAATTSVISAAAQSADMNDLDQAAGTYELIICKSACSFSKPENGFATVAVVLFDRAMTQKDINRIDPYQRYDPGANACYAFKRKLQAQSYAGIDKRGTSSWLLSDQKIRFNLLRSPDASYVVELKRTGDSLVGTGRSAGVGGGAPPAEYTPDTVVGRRVGPPDISACWPGR
jgi:hypothetical protein